MTEKLLLVWQEIPESTKLYSFDIGSKMADLAIASAGKFINRDDVSEGDPVDRLNNLLPDFEPIKTPPDAAGPFARVIVCGFIL